MPRRRSVLASLAAAGAALAGCTGPANPDADESTDGQDDPTESPDAETEGGAETDGNDGDGGSEESDGVGDGSGDEGTETETATADGETEGTPVETGTPSLDLREANVVGVDVSDAGDGEYEFAVTLLHDDEGEDGYANWWQVETLDGEQLGRRDLAHAHGTQEFTRSTTVSIPEGVDCVAVRGHDQTHEYGGQAMLVSLSDGATRAVRQGADPISLADESCP